MKPMRVLLQANLTGAHAEIQVVIMRLLLLSSKMLFSMKKCSKSRMPPIEPTTSA